jgi:hypothetical protein
MKRQEQRLQVLQLLELQREVLPVVQQPEELQQ